MENNILNTNSNLKSNKDENNSKIISTPAKILTKMYLVRLGIILSNISIVCIAISLLSVFAFYLTFCWYVFLVMLVLVTLGTIFAMVPNFKGLFKVEILKSVSQWVSISLPVLIPIGIISAVASIVLLVWDKENIHWGRVIVSSIVVLVTIAFFIAFALGAVK